MIASILAIVFALTSCQAVGRVSDAQKKTFIELLKTLPTKGEFYTEESVKKAAPYLPVLIALTEKDIEMYDIYPFLALTSDLFENKEHRKFAARYFSEIRHPMLKLSWGAMLFDRKSSSPQILRFLRDALESEEQTKLLSEIYGPEFEKFEVRLKAHPDAKR